MILCCVSADVFIEVLCYMFTPWTLLVFHSHFTKIPQALTFAVFFNLAQPQKEAEDVSANTAHNAVESLKLKISFQHPTPMTTRAARKAGSHQENGGGMH